LEVLNFFKIIGFEPKPPGSFEEISIEAHTKTRFTLLSKDTAEEPLRKMIEQSFQKHKL